MLAPIDKLSGYGQAFAGAVNDTWDMSMVGGITRIRFHEEDVYTDGLPSWNRVDNVVLLSWPGYLRIIAAR